MKKIIIYSLILAIIGILGYSAFKEATKVGAKSKRLACHQNVTVFEKIHLPKFLEDFRAKDAKLSASLELIPSKYQASQLFDTIPKSQIQAHIIEHFNADFESKLPLHVKIIIMENDKLDPGKKNADAKSFLGYIRASFYKENALVYQIQIDFLEPNGIKKALLCARDSIISL